MRASTTGIVMSIACVAASAAFAEDDLATLHAEAQALFERGDYPGAASRIKTAVAVAVREFGPDSLDTANIQTSYAALLLMQGEHDEAETVLTAALRTHEKRGQAETPDACIVLNSLALLHHSRGHYALAEPIFKRVLNIQQQHLPADHPDISLTLTGLGLLCHVQGRYAEAAPLCERSLTITERSFGADHVHTAKTLVALAGVYKEQGDYARAEPLFIRARKIFEQSIGPDHPDTAKCQGMIAAISIEQGRHDQAAAVLERSVAALERSVGPRHPLTVEALVNLAVACSGKGEHAKAEQLRQRAVAGLRELKGMEHPDLVVPLNALATVYVARGRLAEAEEFLERVLAISEKMIGPEYPATAQSLNNLAEVYQFQGRDDAAEPLHRRALAINEKTLGPDHPATAASLMNLATLEAAQRRFPAAADLSDRARRVARRHAARVLPALSAAEQVVFLRSRDEGHLHCALSLGLLQKSTPGIARRSAGWLANGKAVGHEAASQQIILARQSANPATTEAVAALARVRAELAKLSQMAPAPDEAVAYRAKLAELQAEEHELVHEIGGQLAALDRDESWVEIDEIRTNIPAGAVLVDFARFGIFDFAAKGQARKWQPARYAAWVIPPAGKGDVTILDLGAAEAIDALVAAYRKGIDAVSGKNGFARGHFTLENEMRKTARPLTQAVLEPILAALAKAGLAPSEIILSPDGALWLLPWQALPLGDGEDAPYAIEKFAFRTVTSGRDLVPPPDDARPKTKSTRGPVVVADPAFDATPPAAAGGDRPTESTRGLAPAGRRLAQVDRLPATLAEARASASALQRIFSREPTTLTGTAASEENVKQEAVRPPALVLATHGYVLPDEEVKRDDSMRFAGGGNNRSTRAVSTTGEPIEDPLLRCGLLLAGANLTNAGKTLPGDDGILTGAEIVGLDLLGTDLVVLSACQTGEGQVNTGEGVAGLRQAFQIAGAKSVVATLWTVPDAESAQIMAGFYDNVARGSPPSLALREAQLAFIKQRRADRNYESAHPFHWAAYGVTGR